MNRRRTARATLLIASFFCTAFVAIAIAAPRPRLVWNASPSVPVGFYRVDPPRPPARGELVVIMPPQPMAHMLAARRYLPPDVPLIKYVAALPGETFCRHGSIVTVAGAQAAIARPHDRAGRPLPVWRGCRRVPHGHLFLITPAADSLDSRYFGSIPSAGLVGIATPLLTRAAPGAPLRWHEAAPAPSTARQKEEPNP